MTRRALTLSQSSFTDYNYNEAIKTLRTNIQFCGSSVRVIMFTSTFPDEGKSELTFETARSLGQIGRKVLLIDADIRKSVLASRCHLNQEVDGLSQYLSGQKNADEVIYDTDIENLSVLFAGPYAPNPSELLADEQFKKLIDYGREYFDYILIDTPPMLNLIDGAIAARFCDGAIMVIESGTISYRLEQKVKRQIEKSGCRILGAVLNKVDTRNEAYYGKYGRYSRYGKS